MLSDSRSQAGFDAAGKAVAQLQQAALLNGPEARDARSAPSSVSDLPAELAEIVRLGSERCQDFQDAAYAEQYDARCRRLISAGDVEDVECRNALIEAARRLALWMCYEDIARVADLKTRPERFDKIRAEAQLKPGELISVVDYLKPRAEEIADVMPVSIGWWIMRRVQRGRGLPFIGRGVRLRSNGVLGYWLLRSMAGLKCLRRRSLRFHEEQVAIDHWLDAMERALGISTKFSAALAELPRVLKGYSDTLVRGKTAYDRIMTELVEPDLSMETAENRAEHLRRAMTAALADDRHEKLDEVLAELNPNAQSQKNMEGATHG